MTMELQFTKLENNIHFIKLIGTLDSTGFNSIDLKFTAYCSGDNVRVLVDLTKVDFLSSIGIRLLTINAKSLSSRNGKMVLLNPIPEVLNVLEITGIPGIIPVYSSQESAETVLLA